MVYQTIQQFSPFSVDPRHELVHRHHRQAHNHLTDCFDSKDMSYSSLVYHSKVFR
ncbi:CLUMA_CG013990, isoform A [Clunio marinus]|uniref:CLUMA_CG013990, isoform A n=1 Tax=Clunio marinus TaxID=568069 RepID=A0A1J1INR2_9DIPT|nr:CLUMA_CG013990, isoform A [Clunio marinus]